MLRDVARPVVGVRCARTGCADVYTRHRVVLILSPCGSVGSTASYANRVVGTVLRRYRTYARRMHAHVHHAVFFGNSDFLLRTVHRWRGSTKTLTGRTFLPWNTFFARLRPTGSFLRRGYVVDNAYVTMRFADTSELPRDKLSSSSFWQSTVIQCTYTYVPHRQQYVMR
jgi:hypothetical protein